LEDLLLSQKIKMDTGGVPVIYFDKVIGLINLAKMTDVPNFAVDLKNIQDLKLAKPIEHDKITEDMPHEEIKEIIEEEQVSTPIEIPQSETLISDNIVEYKKSGLTTLFKNRVILIGLFLSVALILFGGFMIIGQSQLSVPFPRPRPRRLLRFRH